jgi:ferredoxin-NADP reductase
VIKPGWGFSFDYQPGQYIGIGVLMTAAGDGAPTR